ncbi:MAG: cell division protein FtsA [Rhodospirillales bacterium]|nr:cell division protein FtsA [Rhodospirillales bacterium]
MHKSKPKGSVIAALDIGSSKIACFIARVIDEEGHFEVLGIGHQASQGVKNGAVVDLQAAETAIRQTVHAAENMASNAMKGYPLREVIINVPGVHARSHNFAIDVDVMGHEVTDSDVRRALARAQKQALSDDCELVHTIPVGYALDGKDGIREPRGMVGQTLSVGIHMVTGEVGALKNMATCIERSHLDIGALCLSPYAAGLSALVEDEMDLGCTVIDMGGGVTSFAVFSGGAMIYADAVPVGGRHVTSDIAQGLTTSINDAERLKTLYGSAMAASCDENEMIDVPQIGEETHTHPNHVPRSLLVGIIQPRLEEVLELVRARLNDNGLNGVAGRRVVLTGGGSQLPGVRDLAQLILDKQVRLGKPIRVSGLADAVSGPAFATTAGLLTYVAERTDEMPAEIMAMAAPGNLWEQIRYWLKENW